MKEPNTKILAKLAKEATYEAYLRAKNSEGGATILRSTEIITVFADGSYKVLKIGLKPWIKIKKRTKYKLK